jgi:hypothetical protein
MDPMPMSDVAKSLADFSKSQAKTKVVYAASTPRKPLLDHFISSLYGSNE